MENMAHKLIQNELDRYQREAEDKTRRFLQHQDEFLSAVATVELLKNHGLRESAEVCVTNSPVIFSIRFAIYHSHYSAAEIADAVRDAGLNVADVVDGFDDKTLGWVLEGHPSLTIWMPLSTAIPRKPVSTTEYHPSSIYAAANPAEVCA